MQVEQQGWLEDHILKGLQEGDNRAFIQLMSLCCEVLVEYAETKLRDHRRAKVLVDRLLGEWKEENFIRATSPISRWLLVEIDLAIKNLNLSVVK